MSLPSPVNHIDYLLQRKKQLENTLENNSTELNRYRANLRTRLCFFQLTQVEKQIKQETKKQSNMMISR